MNRASSILRAVFLFGIVSFILSQAAYACPYCFGTGAEDSSLADGVKMAIASLVGITGTVLAAFAYFFVRLVRKSEREVNNSESPEPSSEGDN